MSMISPKAFIELECKGKTYKELLKIRDELLKSILDFENDKISPGKWNILPGPETIYQSDLECLGELCMLISETYNKERNSEGKNEDKDIEAIVEELLNRLNSAPDGYKTTTYGLLKESGFDADSFSEVMLTVIHSALFEEADRNGIILDMSSHFGKLEGLPYVLDYIVRKK